MPHTVQQLEEMGIPFRETENGFEAQECYMKTIRNIERNYHPPLVSFRDQLREDIDRCLTRATSFSDFLKRLHGEGYSIKQGKYLAAKSWHGERYIRFKSLGEHYTEASLRGLLDEKLAFEKKLAAKTEEAKTKHSPNVMVLLTVRGYMDSFITYRLPIRKLRPNRPLTWVNDAELDRILSLYRAINKGETLDSMRRRFTELTEQEADLQRTLEHHESLFADPNVMKTVHDELAQVQEQLKSASDMLTMAEKIMNGTYVQDMLDKFSDRKRAEIVPNGYHQSGGRRR